jgi:hypothetical protein
MIPTVSGFAVDSVQNACKLVPTGNLKIWSPECTGENNQPVKEITKKLDLIQSFIKELPPCPPEGTTPLAQVCSDKRADIVENYVDKYHDCGVFPGSANIPANEYCKYKDYLPVEKGALELSTNMNRMQCMLDPDTSISRAFVVPKDLAKLVADPTSNSPIMGPGICKTIFTPKQFTVQAMQKTCINDRKGVWVFDGSVAEGGSCLTFGEFTKGESSNPIPITPASDALGQFSHEFDDATVYSRSLPLFFFLKK